MSLEAALLLKLLTLVFLWFAFSGIYALVVDVIQENIGKEDSQWHVSHPLIVFDLIFMTPYRISKTFISDWHGKIPYTSFMLYKVIETALLAWGIALQILEYRNPTSGIPQLLVWFLLIILWRIKGGKV